MPAAGEHRGRGGGHKRSAGRAGEPSVYAEASWVLKNVLLKKSAFKTLINSSRVQQRRKTNALVSETLKYHNVIKKVFEETKLFSLTSVDEYTAAIIVYDLLFGQRHLQTMGKAESSIARHRPAMVAVVQEMRRVAGVTKNEDLLPIEVRQPPFVPRYARVNTLLTSTEDIITLLQEEGVTLLEDSVTFEDLESRSAHRKTKLGGPIAWVQRDSDVPNLLRFPPSTDFHKHPAYLDGRLILQDKASCFPALALSPPSGSCVIDGCAAPGNKTTHLASIMGNQGQIFACDISERRLNTLRSLSQRAGATCISPLLQSFLDVDPTSDEYKETTHILLDPSCSGSGIVSRLDSLINSLGDEEAESSDDAGRLAALSEFQVSVLLHAFTFPNIQRVSYSTCSIHVEENEGVVARVLAEANGSFRLVKALPHWQRRGQSGVGLSETDARMVVRTDPAQDHVIGFFVALFERVPGSAALPYTPTERPAQTVSASSSTTAVTPAKKRKQTEEGEARKQQTKKVRTNEPRQPAALPPASSQKKRRGRRTKAAVV